MVCSRPGISGRVLLSCAILLTVFLVSCDDDDPVRPRSLVDLGGYVLRSDGTGAAGASVYLGRTLPYWGSPAAFIEDSTLTDRLGRYAFDELDEGSFRVYAGIWNRAGEDFSAVSPFCPPLDFTAGNPAPPVDLLLGEVRKDGVVSGKVFYREGTGVVPADSTTVTLERYRGAQFVPEGTVETTVAGDYAIPAVPTGNYIVHAMRTILPDAPFPSYVAGETAPFFCDGLHLARVPDLMLEEAAVEKPAVYVYPVEPGEHGVRLDFAEGVRMTRSIPEYGEGWDVFIDRDGRIDGRWDYLFYEIAMTGAPLVREGWCLPAAEAEAGLERIVRGLGLNDRETGDFLEYWIPRLPRGRFVVIKPVTGRHLDHLAALQVRPAPDSTLRFWLLFSPSDRFIDLPAPPQDTFVRRGGVVVEWGGAVVPLPR